MKVVTVNILDCWCVHVSLKMTHCSSSGGHEPEQHALYLTISEYWAMWGLPSGLAVRRCWSTPEW